MKKIKIDRFRVVFMVMGGLLMLFAVQPTNTKPIIQNIENKTIQVSDVFYDFTGINNKYNIGDWLYYFTYSGDKHVYKDAFVIGIMIICRHKQLLTDTRDCLQYQVVEERESSDYWFAYEDELQESIGHP